MGSRVILVLPLQPGTGFGITERKIWGIRMIGLRNETKQNIKSCYEELTQVEHGIADFFLNNTEKMDFSSKNIAKLLFVSEATLSRFAKKCGYKGYRELTYSYEQDLEQEKIDVTNQKDISFFSRKVYGYYQNILRDTYESMNEMQIQKIADMLDRCSKVFVYGVGSSGLAAREFQLRFMRVGLDVDVITDSHMMKMSAALVDEACLVIAISLSGKTKEVLDSARKAKKNGATVVFFTANPETETAEYCDEVVRMAYLKNLDMGTKISPQFSVLVIIDILYAYYIDNNAYTKAQKYKETLSALREENGLKVNSKEKQFSEIKI